MAVTIVSENYFKYDKSDYAQSLRQIYGEDGYNKYAEKMNSILNLDEEPKGEKYTNPLAVSKAKNIEAKRLAYKKALALQSEATNVWNRYKSVYEANLNRARRENNGALTYHQRQAAMADAGEGAYAAFRNFNAANSNADEALSLYFDATHSGLAFNLLS